MKVISPRWRYNQHAHFLVSGHGLFPTSYPDRSTFIVDSESYQAARTETFSVEQQKQIRATTLNRIRECTPCPSWPHGTTTHQCTHTPRLRLNNTKVSIYICSHLNPYFVFDRAYPRHPGHLDDIHDTQEGASLVMAVSLKTLGYFYWFTCRARCLVCRSEALCLSLRRPGSNNVWNVFIFCVKVGKHVFRIGKFRLKRKHWIFIFKNSTDSNSARRELSKSGLEVVETAMRFEKINITFSSHIFTKGMNIFFKM